MANKLELLLSLKDKFTGPLGEAKKKLLGSTDAMKKHISSVKDTYDTKLSGIKKKLNDFSIAHVKAFGAMKDEIPGLSRALELMRNPYVALAAAAVSVGVLFTKAASAAATFNHQFLEVRNLNLDKTQAQMDKLSNTVVDLAIKEALDPAATAKAFFDIQSATGKYGREVEEIIAKVGRFSHATKTNFDEAINGTAKGMVNFKFGADQLDRYLASSAKTVQVGITTFDQLARVQTEFAGAAAASGQSFDTANKIFATFSKVTKNVDIAATMTKTAFQGLSDPKVIKAMGEYGIKMFDANKQFLGTDKIIEQLVPKLGKMNDQKFSTFMGDVGGPEGLRELLNQIKVNADDVLKTFQAFDNTEFNIDKALKNANGDFLVLKEMLGNVLMGYLVKLGQHVLPPVIKLLYNLKEWLIEVRPYFIIAVDFFKNLYTSLKTLLSPLRDVIIILGGVKLAMIALSVVMAANPFLAAITAVVALSAALETLYQHNENFKASVDGSIAVAKAFLPVAGAIGLALASPMKANIVNAYNKIKDFDPGKVYNEAHWQSLKASRIRKLNEAMDENSSLTPEEDPLGKKKGSGSSDDGVSKVVGDSHAARNITVHIGAVHEGDNIIRHQGAEGMTAYELEKFMEALIMRTIRNVETGL